MVEETPTPLLNLSCRVACAVVKASGHSSARYYLEVTFRRYSPLTWTASLTSPQFISSTNSLVTHIPFTQIQRHLCMSAVSRWQFWGFSLRLIIFIFSIMSLVSIKSRESREGLETVREYWNGQVCYMRLSKTSWEVPILIFYLLTITAELECMWMSRRRHWNQIFYLCLNVCMPNIHSITQTATHLEEWVVRYLTVTCLV